MNASTKSRPRTRIGARVGEERRGDRRRRVAVVLRRRVVVVVDVRADAVHQRRVQRVEPLGRARARWPCAHPRTASARESRCPSPDAGCRRSRSPCSSPAIAGLRDGHPPGCPPIGWKRDRRPGCESVTCLFSTGSGIRDPGSRSGTVIRRRGLAALRLRGALLGAGRAQNVLQSVVALVALVERQRIRISGQRQRERPRPRPGGRIVNRDRPAHLVGERCA